MVTLPLGYGAYRRLTNKSPEIKLINRYVEKSPTNLREQVALNARPGSTALVQFGSTPNRRLAFFEGMFNDDLFAVHGTTLYRYTSTGDTVAITGTVFGDTHPYVAWSKGDDYERLFISDGLLLQYYDGGSLATGTLTLTPSSPPDITTQEIQIGGAYYKWSTTPAAGTQDGTSGTPWLVKKGATDAESLENMANIIKFAGVPGVDFSTALPGPNLDYTATSDATHLYVTARSSLEDGSDIATTVFSGSHLAWGAATLSGGNVHALVQIETPGGAAPKALAWLNNYVLVSIGNTQLVFFILPGEVTIDALNFFEKESNPDNVEDMLTVGDHVLIMGNGSTEDWYGTGDGDLPFAPIKGQAYSRGVIPGTAVLVQDAVLLIGNDKKVYALSAGGYKDVSNEGISERIRKQLEREAGL